MTLYIPVVLGSIRQGRNTPRLARFILRTLDERDEVRPALMTCASCSFRWSKNDCVFSRRRRPG